MLQGFVKLSARLISHIVRVLGDRVEDVTEPRCIAEPIITVIIVSL